MTPAELRQIGEKLYGPRWQSKLARAFPVSTRTIRYWLSGKRSIRPIVAERIMDLASGYHTHQALSLVRFPLYRSKESAVDQDGLELTQEQLVKITEYATRVIEGKQADVKDVAEALRAVAVCMHRLQAGDPPVSGPEVDLWYDRDIGQNMRVAWTKVKPAAERLRRLNIIE